MKIVDLKKLLPRSFKRAAPRALRSLCDSVAYRLVRQLSGDREFRRIVFVCKGNVCRSPFAEHYLRSLGVGANVWIDSCGLEVDKKGGSPPEAIRIAEEFGLDLSAHRSKGMSECDLQGADLIVAMEYYQYLRLRSMFPEKKGKVRLLRDFAPWPKSLICNIYDPYGLGIDEFENCFKKIQRAITELNSNLASFEVIEPQISLEDDSTMKSSGTGSPKRRYEKI